VRGALEQITLADLAKPIDPANPFISVVSMGTGTADRTKLATKALG
jgi:hypothetical protein